MNKKEIRVYVKITGLYLLLGIIVFFFSGYCLIIEDYLFMFLYLILSMALILTVIKRMNALPCKEN